MRDGGCHLHHARCDRGGQQQRRSFAVDTTAPDTTITKAPKKKKKTKTKKKRKVKVKVKVSFSSDPGSTFECKLDQGAFKSCTSPFAVKAKSKGGKGKKHTITIQATDAVGNVETTAASVKFKLVRKG